MGHGQHVYQRVCAAADAEKYVRDMSATDLSALMDYLDTAPATGIPGLVTGLATVVSAERWLAGRRAHEEGGGQ